LVTVNVLNHSRLVFGKQTLVKGLGLNWPVEKVRSFLFSFVVSLLGAEVSFVSTDGTLIALESMKWYFVNTATAELKHPVSLKEALSRYSPIHPRIASELVSLRRNYRASRGFALACPLYLAYLALKMRGHRPNPSSSTSSRTIHVGPARSSARAQTDYE
jgi:hypothetical protein